MLQDLPEITFSERAVELRAFLYDHWCAHGRGPNLRDVHEATGLSRDEILAGYRELEHGIILVMDPRSPNGSLLKLQPFSSYPSQVAVHIDGDFHSWAGCAMESVAISRMPPFEGRPVRLESYCACCLTPISIDATDGELTVVTPAGGAEDVRVHVSLPPREWGMPNIASMCDSMNWVLGASHAERYERQVGRRGVLFTIDQAKAFVKRTADERMWHRDWPAGQMQAKVIVGFLSHLGVDVSAWTP